MKTIEVVMGTRPEAIKLASLCKILASRKDEIAFKVISTAQHRKMLDDVLRIFNIHPNHNLMIMKENQSLFDISVNALDRLKKVFEHDNPDIVVVQGDTTTAFVASLAAFYQRREIAHVEAGLRTYLKFAPYPEEINRHLISVLADYHFAPTERAKINLLQEAVPPEKIHVVGNTVIDALFDTVKTIRENSVLRERLKGQLPYPAEGRRLVLVTAHRRESFGKGLRSICEAILTLVKRNPDIEIVYPVHLNPVVKETVDSILSGIDRIHLLEPLDYLSFVWLMKRSSLILTDSGGIQEEAPSLGKIVLVMREATERPEAIDAGCARLVGVEFDKIIKEVEIALKEESKEKIPSSSRNLFGDGHSAERIADVLIDSQSSSK